MTFQKGHQGYWKGKKHTPEMIAKRSVAISRALTGRKLSEEHKDALRRAKIGKTGPLANNWKGGITLDESYSKKSYKKRYELGVLWKQTHPEEYRIMSIRNGTEWRKKNPDKARAISRRAKEIRKKMIGSHTEEEWEVIKKESGYKCKYCGRGSDEAKLSKDHIIPVSKGGTDYASNIQLLCISCNSKKSTKIL
jgi:5-methylcytosine-specific restriction endonuclease McrA